VPDEAGPKPVGALFRQHVEGATQLDDLLDHELAVSGRVAGDRLLPREELWRQKGWHPVLRQGERIRKELGPVRVRLLSLPVRPEDGCAGVPFRAHEIGRDGSTGGLECDVVDFGAAFGRLLLQPKCERR
jgi:hypothetical protein